MSAPVLWVWVFGIHPDVKDTTTRKLLVGALAALPYRGQTRKETEMEKKYVVEKIRGIYSGAGWQSKSDIVEEWAVIIEPYGIQVKSFKTEAEAVEYLKSSIETRLHDKEMSK